MTVTGPVPAAELGATLMHEHLFLDFRCRYRPTGEQEPDSFRPEDRWRYVRDPAGYAANLVRDDLDDALHELQGFREGGGGAVLDVTPEGLGRDRAALRRAAEGSGVAVVASAGFYVHLSHSAWLHRATEEELAERMAADVLVGDDDGIRCGFIGELGVDTFEPCEVKVVLAAARAQQLSGASVAIHTASGALADLRPQTLDLVRRFIDAGGDPSRLVLCHQDGSGDDRSHQDALLREGVVLSYDTFGFETCFRRGEAYAQLPTDTRRIDEVRDLWDRGHGHQVVLSHDVCYRMMTRRWGGWGIGHLLSSLAPRFDAAGLGPEAREVMFERTPARLLALAVPV